ncbi:MAG: CPBP family intramembrane metalloprotease [Polyangiaceae bacterium]|nr:CPBP family intramembrane metalloprotease [Polyangiaceae bacterium]
MSNREIGRFLFVVFTLGLGAQCAAIASGGATPSGGWLRLAMWAPAVAVLTSRSARRLAWGAIRRSGGIWLPLALLVGWSLVLVQNALLFTTGGGTWNEKLFSTNPDGTGIAAVNGVAMVLGVGPQSYGFFSLNLLVTLTIGSLLVGVLGGVGEELGWRAVLQPALEDRFGATRSRVIVGVIWAYWHLPVNLAGYNDPAHPLLNTLLFFPLVVLAMAFSFGWLTRRSSSVWPAAIAHGANNIINTGFLLTPRSWAWDTTTALAAAAIVGGLFAAMTVRRASSDVAPAPAAAIGA